jgi:myosin-5
MGQLVPLRLGATPEKLESSLVTRRIIAGGESITQRLNADQAADGRDALAKAMYAALFDWLVVQINASFAKEKGYVLTTISILDIYGFEYFKRNSFEQLCINYANERLQQQFNRHLFKLEQEEYEKENIDWTKVEFEDNQACLDLIEKRPMGILSLLDEQCNFPKATDATFAQKMASELKENPRYTRDKLNENVFHVNHYAGSVNYDTAGFLDKNRDTIHQDLMEVLIESGEEMVRALAGAMNKEKTAEVENAGGLRARWGAVQVQSSSIQLAHSA